MITEKLISMLDSHLAKLNKSWVKMVQVNENTASYHKMDQKKLGERSKFVYEKLKMWLDWQITSKEVAKVFWQLGLDRKNQNIPLSEVHYALILTKRNLYINILEKLGKDDVADMEELIAFTSRITYFFDKAGHFIIKGYEGLNEPSEEDETALDDILAAFRAGSSPD